MPRRQRAIGEAAHQLEELPVEGDGALGPGTALDLGCGTGDNSIYLAKHGWHVTGVDFVAKAGSDPHVMGMMSASAGAIMQHLMPRMPFDPKKDIAPLTLMVGSNGAIRVAHCRVAGVIEKDAFADLVAVPGDPLKDVSVLSKIDWVMKAGQVVRSLPR